LEELHKPHLSNSELLELQVLEFVYDRSRENPASEVSFESLYATADRREIQEAAERLDDRYLLFVERGLAGIDGGMLTPRGVTFVENMRESRSSRAARSVALRDGILAWLYDLGYGKSPTLNTFLQSKYSRFYGEMYTAAELNSASRRMRDDGQINGQGSHGAGIMRPSITSKGMQMVERGESVSDAGTPDPAQSVTLNVYGNGSNLAFNSTGVTQTNSVSSEAVRSAQETVAAVRAVIDLLVQDGVDRELLTSRLVEAESVEVVQNPRAFSSALSRLRDAVISGAGGAIGATLGQNLTLAVALIGG